MEGNKTMSTTNPDQTPKITVYRGWLDPGKYVWSPFVIKLEARLRFAEIPYVTEPGSMREAPKGKIPYIECRDLQPSTLGDSALIIKHLIEENVLLDINAKLSSTTRTQDLALRALLEDKLYFYHTWERWIENYYTMRDRVLPAVPFPVRVVVGLVIYRKVAATLSGQGTSRYTVDEIRSFRREIWESINELLISAKATTSPSDGPFWVLGGENPTEADTTLFGFIVSVLVCTAGPESQSLVKEFPVLLEYAGRIHDAYFPDYVKWS